MKATVEITLDQAKEWYKKGGDWAKLALSAFSKEILTQHDFESFIACNKYQVTTHIFEGISYTPNVHLDIVYLKSYNQLRFLANFYNDRNKGTSSKYFLQARDPRSESKKGFIPGYDFVAVGEHKQARQIGCVYFNRQEDAIKTVKILGEKALKILLKGGYE